MTNPVQHNPAARRYELLDDHGQVVGIADYHRRDDAVVIPHTEIVPRLRGQGLGARLVQGTLDRLREQGERVVPSCWYVRQYIDDHPEYADLLAAPQGQPATRP